MCCPPFSRHFRCIAVFRTVSRFVGSCPPHALVPRLARAILLTRRDSPQVVRQGGPKMLAHVPKTIVHVLKEDRLFPPSEDFTNQSQIRSLAEYQRLWNEAATDPEQFWAKLAGELHWFKPYDRSAASGRSRWPSGSSAARRTSSYNCLDAHLGTPRAGQGGHHLGGRARRLARADLPRCCTAKCVEVRQRAQGAGHRTGRRGGDLHAHGARAGRRHAGLRPDRRGPLGGFRRVLGRGHRRPEQRRAGRSFRSRPTAAGGAARCCR